jgi:peptide/nickel transport system permease protein
VLGAAVVASTLGVANAVILETTVSYFGLGIQPPTASWGNMLSKSQLNM